jgi:hypothetical protein
VKVILGKAIITKTSAARLGASPYEKSGEGSLIKNYCKNTVILRIKYRLHPIFVAPHL